MRRDIIKLMFPQLINDLFASLTSLPFDTLIWFVLGTYGAIFIVVFALCLLSARFKALSKRPFLCFTNAYAALVLAAFLICCELGQSILAAAMFWTVGYALYGILCFLSVKKQPTAPVYTQQVSAMPTAVPPQRSAKADYAPAQQPAKNSVRLEHAMTVTDKLLTKNLSKPDRQDLEKLKNTLAVLQIKGSLTPIEAEILNDNFNALLKLMAKYNV